MFFMWGVASLLAGKSQDLFGAAVCKIQALKHYVDSLPLVLKGKKKVSSHKLKGSFLQLPLDCALKVKWQ